MPLMYSYTYSLARWLVVFLTFSHFTEMIAHGKQFAWILLQLTAHAVSKREPGS